MPRLAARLALALPLAVAPLAAGCDSLADGDQALFEDQAYLSAVGTVEGWPVGPAFDARVSVLTPPTPDPAGPGDLVTMQLDATVAVPGGLALYRLDLADGALDLVQVLDGQDGPWFYTFSFLGRETDPFGRPGTYRLLVLDAGDRVVTYGDFTLLP